MRHPILVMSVVTIAFCVAGLAQPSQSGLGRTPTEEELRAWDAEVMSAPGKGAIEGRVIDQVCYAVAKSKTGVADKQVSDTCATECGKKGRPMALLTADGKIYAITGELAESSNNAKLIAHCGHTIEVAGNVMDHGGGNLMVEGTTFRMISK